MRRFFCLLLLLIVPAGAARSWSLARQAWAYPNRFAELVPGRLYRGGRPAAEHIDLLADRGVKTILCLTDESKAPQERSALSAIRGHRMELIRIPMPGDGTASFDLLDRAADVVADEAKWPMYFHCAAGKQRSNAVMAAYLMKHKNLSLDDTMRELQQEHDLDPVDEKRLHDHIVSYAQHLGNPATTNPAEPE